MKSILLAVLFASALLFGSCATDYLVTESAPDYITRDSLNNSVATIPAQPILSPARVISEGNYLFVNEPYKGWHVIDNTIPATPQNVAYITAPGSLDGSATNSYLYLENSVDLVVLSIANPVQPVVVKRMQNVLGFPSSPYSPTEFQYPNNGMEIVNWHDTTVNTSIPAAF